MDFLHQSVAPPLVLMDYIGPAIGATLFVIIMSTVPEPTRRTLNAVLVAGASGVYLSGGFGAWELAFSGRRHAHRLSWVAVVSLHRPCLADARRLGSASPLLGASYLALYVDFVVRLFCVRRADCDVVYRGHAWCLAATGDDKQRRGLSVPAPGWTHMAPPRVGGLRPAPSKRSSGRWVD